MAKLGYARVSTTDQAEALTQQIEKLEKVGCDIIRTEQISGQKKYKDRPQLNTILDFIREGDYLVVVKIDRLGRSLQDLITLVELVKSKGAFLEVIDQKVDTSTSSGRLFFNILGAAAEFETDMRRERQLEGIQRAQREGKYKGRKKRLTKDQEKELVERFKQGVPRQQLMDEYDISRQSIYDYINRLS